MQQNGAKTLQMTVGIDSLYLHRTQRVVRPLAGCSSKLIKHR